MGFDQACKRKKLMLILAAFGFSSYGAYTVYYLPYVIHKRKRLSKLLGAFISVAEAVSYYAETIGTISGDMKEFLQSESDEIPNSLRQISKIIRSNEFSDSLTSSTQAVTVGVLRGYQSKKRIDRDETCSSSSFLDQVMNKLFTTAGSGFSSVVVGSLARNLVMAFYSDEQPSGKSNTSDSTSAGHGGSELDSLPIWVNVVSDGKCRQLIVDSIKLFVSTAVALYLDKTMHINTYDEFFSSLTNPKHENKLRDMLVSVCNGAVETLVQTSHQVIRSSDTNVNPNSASSFIIEESPTPTRSGDMGYETSSKELKSSNSTADEKEHGWVSKVASTPSVPRARRFVLDVTGRDTFETIRSFIEFLLEKLYHGVKRCVNVVHEAVIETGLGIVRYAAAKSTVIATICLSLYFQVVGGVRVLMPV